MIQVLLVCRGNLCRSPMALAITAHHLRLFGLHHGVRLGSAGTHASTHRKHPDPRAMATLQRFGYAPARQSARAVVQSDFERYDLLLAMDPSNLADLQAQCPEALQHKLQLFLHHTPDAIGREIPDPYFGAPSGFERVLRLCEVGARAWVGRWVAKAAV